MASEHPIMYLSVGEFIKLLDRHQMNFSKMWVLRAVKAVVNGEVDGVRIVPVSEIAERGGEAGDNGS